MQTVTINIYKFNELSDEAKKKAIEYFSNINTNFDWWKDIFDEDAKTIGLTIESFEINSNKIKGHFDIMPNEVAKLILENHGENTDTYKEARMFLLGMVSNKNFLHNLLYCYLGILKNQYDSLVSDEVIEETIIANEYNFTIDGNFYYKK